MTLVTSDWYQTHGHHAWMREWCLNGMSHGELGALFSTSMSLVEIAERHPTRVVVPRD